MHDCSPYFHSFHYCYQLSKTAVFNLVFFFLPLIFTDLFIDNLISFLYIPALFTTVFQYFPNPIFLLIFPFIFFCHWYRFQNPLLQFFPLTFSSNVVPSVSCFQLLELKGFTFLHKNGFTCTLFDPYFCRMSEEIRNNLDIRKESNMYFADFLRNVSSFEIAFINNDQCALERKYI
jgi:hypothetical protein